MSQSTRDEPIAIIGMAGRFPAAADIDQLWAHLSAGVESVRTPTDEELLAAGVPAQALSDPHYVKATAEPADADAFDAELFRMTPREARICDPQMRMFLECAHAAIENAGYDHTQLTDVGVFGSVGPNQYLELVRRAEGADLRGSAGTVKSLNLPDYLAPLVSYKLGLRGPSVVIQTACSSSLVTTHLAAAALRTGDCDLALAGAVDLMVPFGHGYWWEPDGTLSREGRCRPFDKAASGAVYGAGAGMVVLKRLSDALADRDHIRAVLLATAVNNDGGTAVGFVAPSVGGQAAVIAEAMSLAGVSGQDVTMVEGHAVGSPLGDQIEVAALTSAFRRQGEPEPGSCALGSIKGNIGHLGRAAGVTSLIKAALALEHGTIPGSGGFSEPNPDLRLGETPFYVPDRTVPWPRQPGRPRYASVNAFGYGGSNAHAVLTEAPAPAPADVAVRPRVVVWSARTPEAADAYRERLATYFAGNADPVNFAGSAATLQQGRTPYASRGAVVAADAREAVALLSRRDAAGLPVAADAGRRVALLFPGLEAAHAAMAHELPGRSPAFAATLDECFDRFEAEGVPARAAWRSGDVPGDVTEPLVFAVSYALAQLWQSWGIKVAAVLGHGVGELAAATVAGVFSLADGVRLVAVRTRELAQTAPGGVLLVAGTPQDVRPLLPEGAAVAAVNGPRQVAVAGAAEVLDETVAAIDAAGLRYRRLPTTRALHHWLVSPAVPQLERELRSVDLSVPTIDLFSSTAGRMLTADEATDPGYWSRQIAQPSQFSTALAGLLADPARQVLLEVGPGRTLTALARQQPAVLDGRHPVLSTLPAGPTDPPEDWRSVLTAAAGLWTEGQTPDWTMVEDLSAVGRVPVPGYPYQRQRYWIDESVVNGAATPPALAEPATPASDTTRRLRLLWAGMLGRPEVGPDGDFFDLGGNSLSAIELMSRIRAEFQVSFGVDSLFDDPTPAGLAGLIDGRQP